MNIVISFALLIHHPHSSILVPVIRNSFTDSWGHIRMDVVVNVGAINKKQKDGLAVCLRSLSKAAGHDTIATAAALLLSFSAHPYLAARKLQAHVSACCSLRFLYLQKNKLDTLHHGSS